MNTLCKIIAVSYLLYLATSAMEFPQHSPLCDFDLITQDDDSMESTEDDSTDSVEYWPAYLQPETLDAILGKSIFKFSPEKLVETLQKLPRATRACIEELSSPQEKSYILKCVNTFLQAKGLQEPGQINPRLQSPLHPQPAPAPLPTLEPIPAPQAFPQRQSYIYFPQPIIYVANNNNTAVPHSQTRYRPILPIPIRASAKPKISPKKVPS